MVDWEAADWARFSLNANGWIDHSPPQAPQLIGYYPSVPGGTPAGVLPLTFPPETPRAADWGLGIQDLRGRRDLYHIRSEEHTSELQSLMRISYAVFCLKKKKK